LFSWRSLLFSFASFSSSWACSDIILACTSAWSENCLRLKDSICATCGAAARGPQPARRRARAERAARPHPIERRLDDALLAAGQEHVLNLAVLLRDVLLADDHGLAVLAARRAVLAVVRAAFLVRRHPAHARLALPRAQQRANRHRRKGGERSAERSGRAAGALTMMCEQEVRRNWASTGPGPIGVMHLLHHVPAATSILRRLRRRQQQQGSHWLLQR